MPGAILGLGQKQNPWSLCSNGSYILVGARQCTWSDVGPVMCALEKSAEAKGEW